MLSLDPQYLGDVLEDIRRVGKATGTEDKAESIASRMQARIDAVVERAAQASLSLIHISEPTRPY